MKLLIEHWRVASGLFVLLIAFLGMILWPEQLGSKQLKSLNSTAEETKSNLEKFPEPNVELKYRREQKEQLMLQLKDYELKVANYKESNSQYTLEQLQVHKQYLEEKLNKLEAFISALND